MCLFFMHLRGGWHNGGTLVKHFQMYFNGFNQSKGVYNVKKINWLVRFKNKTFVVAFVTTVVAFVYQILALLGIVPAVTEDSVMQLIMIIINMLTALGIVTDPTTQGISDSDRAMTYK